MADKMLGKIVAGAALGGASLLVFTPGMAYAGGHDDEGKVIAKPHVVKAGDKVELLQICAEPQEHAYVWSKVTGKVDLHPARDGEHGDWADQGGSNWADQGGDWAEDADQGPDGKDGHGEEHGKAPEGKDEHGKAEEGKGPEGKPEEGKGPEGKPEEGKGPEGKPEEGKGPEGKPEEGKDGHGPGEAGMPEPPADAPKPAGMGAGMAADAGDQGPQGHEEYGQDAEPGWDAADWTRDEYGPDGKDGHGQEAKDEHGARPEGKKDEHGKDGKDEHGKDAKDEHGADAKDEHGKDGKDEHGQEAKDEHGKDGKDEHGKDGKDEHGGWQEDWQDDAGYGQGEDEAGWEHGKDFVYYGEARVSEDVHPGRYELKGSCGEGELVVLPRGGVDGGDGGMATTGLDRGLATGGAGMIGAAALGGLVLLRRRRAGGLV
ncbi:hypothetical protein ACH495_05335 [Micromonospora sp. NPDC018662]|uniref:hypothetical protein n=1 Tax=Micromonospora sp. NPDC018662 TaxID=3364238 RepID=UPI0037A3C3E3